MCFVLFITDYTSTIIYVSINQNPQSATRAQEKPHSSATTRAANPADAKRRRLGGLRASLRDSLYVYTLFTKAREKLLRKTTSQV